MCFTHKFVLFLPTDFYFHVVIVVATYPPPAAIDTNNVCPLPEPCHMHAGECLSSSLCKNVKYSEWDIKLHFPSWHTGCGLHTYTNRGGHKSSSLESFVLKAKRYEGRRFIWLHYVCMVRLTQPSFLSDALLNHYTSLHIDPVSNNDNVPFISIGFTCLCFKRSWNILADDSQAYIWFEQTWQ